ncbi:ABC transporter ATP-binding protein [Teredinibacter sp. KSP-S5-2]|uniref:ABC transporter ATP-binding protein n=1 Tax=Teredinibacter sp. KSP-S5-2 TaxID=3034506 RepID=UPI0029351915|nr:ABC transporter ATP-binding protein [Teredinibacter sp. KSP-S5-2]WNO11304.1 ABC transporter ATP-binding protein [Teredinibacter sp. KSP-S5-2]
MSSGPVIKLSNVSKSFKKGSQQVNVLSDCELEIYKGDFVALMGPSGSGKSTLLNLIGGLDKPDSGCVQIDGMNIETLTPNELSKWRARKIGFIFQFYNLVPVLNAQMNVELPLLLTNLTSKERKRRAKIALSIVGLSDREKHFPKELSGGQQQRTAIARAFVTDPELLLCDEPTGDLDEESALEILELLKFLNSEQGKTVIMVTHDPKAASYAKKTLHMTKGGFILNRTEVA